MAQITINEGLAWLKPLAEITTLKRSAAMPLTPVEMPETIEVAQLGSGAKSIPALAALERISLPADGADTSCPSIRAWLC